MIRRGLVVVAVTACGGGRPLDPPHEPPVWPLHNLVAEHGGKVPASDLASADAADPTDDEASGAPAAPDVAAALPVSALLPGLADAATLRCGDAATELDVSSSLLALPAPVTATCTLDVTVGDATHQLSLPDGPGPLTCTWAPPACGAPIPGAAP